jgi:hypothetical protein
MCKTDTYEILFDQSGVALTATVAVHVTYRSFERYSERIALNTIYADRG